MIQRHHIIFIVCLCFISWSPAFAGEQPFAAVEVVIDGHRYDSMAAYQHEQIKRALKRVLSAYNLSKFREEELYAIIKEVRDEQRTASQKMIDGKDEPSKGHLRESGPKQGAENLSPTQMEDMLKDYFRKHKRAEPLSIDADKVKNIIIDPE